MGSSMTRRLKTAILAALVIAGVLPTTTEAFGLLKAKKKLALASIATAGAAVGGAVVGGAALAYWLQRQSTSLTTETRWSRRQIRPPCRTIGTLLWMMTIFPNRIKMMM